MNLSKVNFKVHRNQLNTKIKFGDFFCPLLNMLENIHNWQDCKRPYYYSLQELNHQYNSDQHSSHFFDIEIYVNWCMKTFATRCMPMTGNMQIAALENEKTS